MKARTRSAAETDLFGGGEPAPRRQRALSRPLLPPQPLTLPSPGNRLGAEMWLADALGQSGARVENLLRGEMQGVLVTFQDGTEWTFAAADRPGVLHELATYDDADLESERDTARTQGHDEGESEAWEAAKKKAEEVAAEAVDRTANLLLDRFHAQQRLFRRPRITKRRRNRNGRRKRLEWRRPEPLELDRHDRKDLEEGALDAGWN